MILEILEAKNYIFAVIHASATNNILLFCKIIVLDLFFCLLEEIDIQTVLYLVNLAW